MRPGHAARVRLTAGVLFAAALVSAGCSVLIGVAGDPVVVGDDDGGTMEVEVAVESGAESDTALPGDAASADETDAGDADAHAGADARD